MKIYEYKFSATENCANENDEHSSCCQICMNSYINDDKKKFINYIHCRHKYCCNSCFKKIMKNEKQQERISYKCPWCRISYIFSYNTLRRRKVNTLYAYQLNDTLLYVSYVLSKELYEISIEQLIERIIPSEQSRPNGQHSQVTQGTQDTQETQVTQGTQVTQVTTIPLQSALNRVRMRRLIQERKQKLAVENKIIHLTLFAIIYCVIIMIFY